VPNLLPRYGIKNIIDKHITNSPAVSTVNVKKSMYNLILLFDIYANETCKKYTNHYTTGNKHKQVNKCEQAMWIYRIPKECSKLNHTLYECIFYKPLKFFDVILPNLPKNHNILELVLRRPSCYSAKPCSKSLLKKDLIPFLSSYAYSSTATCTFLPL
jgi:hypothetical protein